MNRRLKVLSEGLLVALALGLAGCNLLSLSDEPATDGVHSGSFTVQISPISTAVQEAIARYDARTNSSSVPRSVSSRAYIAAQRVDLVATPTAGGDPTQWTDYPSFQTPEQPLTVGSRTLPAGDYTLTATVFNAPDDTTPTVSGSTTFTVTAGQQASDNPVLVTCKPLNPQSLAAGTVTPFTLQQAFVLGMNAGISSIGDEQWFEITPSSAWTGVYVISDNPQSYAVGLIYREDGTIVNGLDPTVPAGGTVSAAAFDTVPDATYYVGVIAISPTDLQNATLSIQYQPIDLVVDEAVSVAFSDDYQPQTIQNFHEGWYSFPVTGGQLYSVNWDGFSEGSGQYGAQIDVTGYNGDQSVTYFGPTNTGYKGPTFYREGYYQSYSIDHTQWIEPLQDGTVLLKVVEEIPGATAGSFGLRVKSLGTNRPPSIDAYPDSDVVAVGTTVNLNSYGSDPDAADSLSYSWAIVAGPSSNGLESANQQFATFTADTPGTYEIRVTVTDNGTPPLGATASVFITAVTNSPPQFDYAYPSVWNVALDGFPTIELYGGASDPDNDTVSYDWYFGSQPSTSYCAIQGWNQPDAFFSPDVAGDYVINLTVTDQFGATASTSFTVTVSDAGADGGAGIGIY